MPLLLQLASLYSVLQWAGTTAQAKDKDLKDREDERRKEAEAQDKDLKDRKDERRKEVEAQDKDLNNQAEERFQKVVEWLGSDKEQAQVGAAVMLQRFVQTRVQRV